MTNLNIAIFGSSHLRGINFSDLGKSLAVDIQVFSAPGAGFFTIVEGEMRKNDKKVYNNCISFKPDLLIVLLGGNDLDRKDDPKFNLVNSFIDHLVTFEIQINKKLNLKWPIKFIEIVPREGFRNTNYQHFKTVLNAISRFMKKNYKDNFLCISCSPFNINVSMLCNDLVHLNSTGKQCLSDALEFYIKKLIKT